MSAKSQLTGEALKTDIKRRNALAAKKARAKKKAAREAEKAAAELAAPKAEAPPADKNLVLVATSGKGRRVAKAVQDSSKTPSMKAKERRTAKYKALREQYPDNVFYKEKMYTPEEWQERSAKAIAKAERQRAAVAEHNASVHLHDSIARELQKHQDEERYQAERAVKQRSLVDWIVNMHSINSRPELEELRVTLQRLKNEGPRAHIYNTSAKQWREDSLNPDMPLADPPARMAWQSAITVQTQRKKRTVPEWYQWVEEFDYDDHPCENQKLYLSLREKGGDK